MTQRDEARQWREYEFVTCLELFPAGATAECHQPTAHTWINKFNYQLFHPFLQIEREKTDLSVQVISLSERLEEAEGGAESQVNNTRHLARHLSADLRTSFLLSLSVLVRSQSQARCWVDQNAQTSWGRPFGIRRNGPFAQEEAPRNCCWLQRTNWSSLEG